MLMPTATAPVDAVPKGSTLLTGEQEDLCEKAVCYQRQDSG